jgi:hypothetical protein
MKSTPAVSSARRIASSLAAVSERPLLGNLGSPVLAALFPEPDPFIPASDGVAAFQLPHP